MARDILGHLWSEDGLLVHLRRMRRRKLLHPRVTFCAEGRSLGCGSGALGGVACVDGARDGGPEVGERKRDQKRRQENLEHGCV